MMVKFGHRMGSIFISYRRDDSEGQAGRLYDDLVAVFGSDSVFMDVAAIQPGRDFRTEINQSLSSCGVFLSVIGKSWLTATDTSGQCRLNDPADFVRIETAAVLKRDIPVIPVLVQGATAPKPDQLPDDLKNLAYRNVMELTHPRWESDVRLLIQAVRPYASRPNAGPGKKSIRLKYLLLATGMLLVLGMVVYFWPGTKANGHPTRELKKTNASPTSTASVAPETTKPTPQKPVGSSVRRSIEMNASPTSPASVAPETTKRTPEKIATQEPNALGDVVEDYSLAAEQEQLANNPRRYTFTLSLNAPSGIIGDIARVHYNLVHNTNPLSLDGGNAPRFGAVYEGWGCYQTVVVTVYFKSRISKPLEKTFNMCKALGQ
jgi:TIR domain